MLILYSSEEADCWNMLGDKLDYEYMVVGRDIGRSSIVLLD